MSLIRYNPFNELSSLFEGDFDKFLDHPLLKRSDLSRISSPNIDIQETNEEYQIKADLPGLKKEDINIEWVKNSIVISGERKEEKEEKESNYYKKEISYGSFKRQIPLSENVDSEKISAAYTDGVLTVKVPKTEQLKAKQIQINS